ncbi:hypothetical protein MHU86_19200 [Fragilaria crotonensis]|nr:hypothetical protein MHU86_19200 [Fragilaria crotonensis]
MLPPHPPPCFQKRLPLTPQPQNLERASFRARQLQQLLKNMRASTSPLRGFQPDWESVTTIREDWKTMTSACLLHFDGDVATVVRWIGGHHTNAHLNPPEILAKLRPIIDTDIWSDLQRILTTGAPAFCNATASESNFQAYLQYGNHTSVTDNQAVFADTIVKQSKRGLTIIMDPALVHFALNVHLSPQGLVDVLHHRRKPRPLSDSSFRPWPGAYAINDWTNKCHEPSSTSPTLSTTSANGIGISPYHTLPMTATPATMMSSVHSPESSITPT